MPSVASSQVDVGLGAEPRALALRERDVALGVELDRGVAGELAVEDGPGLAIADRREGRQARIEPLAQRARLLDQAGVELGAGPGRDPRRDGRRVDGWSPSQASGPG